MENFFVTLADHPERFTRLFSVSRRVYRDIILRFGLVLNDDNLVDTNWPEGTIPLFAKLNLFLLFLRSGSMALSMALAGIECKTMAYSSLAYIAERIAMMSDTIIRMPTSDDNEIDRIKLAFADKCEVPMPDIVGIIDCTQICITQPSRRQAGRPSKQFYCRKEFYSLNVQTICDPDLRIMNIVTNYPGAASDKNIYNASAVKTSLEASQHGQNSLLIGDLGYEMSECLLLQYDCTYRKKLTPSMKLFNRQHSILRRIIDDCHRTWKGKFKMFDTPIRIRNLATVQNIIRASAVIHNICIDVEKSQLLPMPANSQQPSAPTTDGDWGTSWYIRRDLIAKQLFAHQRENKN